MAGREYVSNFQLIVSPEEQRRRDAIAQGIVQDELTTAIDVGDTQSASHLQQELKNRFSGKTAQAPTYTETSPFAASTTTQTQSSDGWTVVDPGWTRKKGKSATPSGWEDVSSQFYYAGAQPKEQQPDDSFTGSMARGIKKTIPELKQAGAGAIAYLGDVFGADGVKEWGLNKYHEIEDSTKNLQSANDSFSKVVIDGEGSFKSWLGNAVGYSIGQVGLALVSGGVGAIGGKLIAKQGITKLVETEVAKSFEKNIAAGMAEEAAKAAATKVGQEAAAGALIAARNTGAVTGAFLHNETQELGSIYNDAVEQAKKEGRQLDGGDLVRIGAASLAAAGVDTAMEAVNFNKLTKGGIGPTLAKRAAVEIPPGMVREGVTEAIQTGIEQYGAGKPLDTREIIDSAALGAVGGGMAGAGASFRQKTASDAQSIEQAANLPVTPVISPEEIAAIPQAPVELSPREQRQQAVADKLYPLPTQRDAAPTAERQLEAINAINPLPEQRDGTTGVRQTPFTDAEIAAGVERAQAPARAIEEAYRLNEREQQDAAFQQAQQPQGATPLAFNDAAALPATNAAEATTQANSVLLESAKQAKSSLLDQQVTIRADGKPFATLKAAETSIKARGLSGAVAVSVKGGGFGIRMAAPASAPINVGQTNEPANQRIASPVRDDGIQGNLAPTPNAPTQPQPSAQSNGAPTVAGNAMAAGLRDGGGTNLADAGKPQSDGTGIAELKNEIGWAEQGGRMIRAAGSDGTVNSETVSRTKWIPKPDFWPNRPKQGGAITEAQASVAIDKAIAGQPLNARERRFVEYATKFNTERTLSQPALTQTEKTDETDISEAEYEHYKQTGEPGFGWMPQTEDAASRIEALTDDDLEFAASDKPDTPQSLRDGMASLGFTQQEIDNEVTAKFGQQAQGSIQGDAEPTASTAESPSPSGTQAPPAAEVAEPSPNEIAAKALETAAEALRNINRPALDLTAPTESKLRADDAKQKRDAADKAAKDNAPSPEGFALSGSDRAADVGAAAGQNALLEPQSPYGQQDLFAETVPDADRANLVARVERSAAPSRPDGIDAKAAIDRAAQRDLPGRYSTGVTLVRSATHKSSVATVNSMKDAALATRSLADLVREHVDVLVTDKDGKVIAVQRMFAGATSQTFAHPGEIIKFATAIKDAAFFYVSHNHPSDNRNLSNADRALSDNIADQSRSIGPRYQGILAVTSSGYSAYNGLSETGSLDAGETPHDISYLEERIERRGYLGPVMSDPVQAAKVIADISAGGQGIVFLDASLHPTGFFPITMESGKLLKNKDVARDIVAAAYRSRASGAIIATQGQSETSQSYSAGVNDGARNIGTLLARIDVSVMDIIDDKGRGRAKFGEPMSGDVLFSRSNTIEVDGEQRPRNNSNGKPIAATDEGIRNFWRWFGSSRVVDNAFAELLAKPDGARILADDLLAAQGSTGSGLDLVQALMLALSQNNKIGDAIVGLIPVDVVNSLAKNGVGTKDAGRNRSMLIDALNAPVSNEVLSSFRGVLTSLSTVLANSLSSPSNKEIAPALLAGDFNLREVGALLSLQSSADFWSSDSRIESIGASNAAKPTPSGFSAPAKNQKLDVTALASLLDKFISFAPHAKTSIKDDLPTAKIIAQQGRPLVVYHGTNQDIDAFRADRLGQNTSAISATGFYFSEEPREAAEYADMSARKQVSNAIEREAANARFQKDMDRAIRRNDFDAQERITLEWEASEQEAMSGEERGANILPAFLNINNPMVVDMHDHVDLSKIRNAIEIAKLENNDGIKLVNVYDPVGDRPEGFSTTQWIAFKPNQIKSATRNTGAFSPDNADIRYSFAGTRAKTADKMGLASAQSRLNAGEDAETVRQDTGWHKGVDDKWRFEISDDDAHMKGMGTLSEIMTKRAAALGKEGQSITLEDILFHPSLYAAYPSIAKTEVKTKAGRGATLAATKIDGVTYPQYSTILMGRDVPAKDTLSILLHEIQHGIQHVEGFATGSSPKKYAKDLPDGSYDNGFGEYRREAGEVEARNTQARQKMTESQRKATPPSATADAPNSDVIVTFNGVTMDNAPQPANAELPNTYAADVIAKAAKTVTTPLDVYATPKEAAKALGIDIPSDARGLFYKGRASLISSNITSPRMAEFVLFHELLHAGITQVAPRYGNEYNRIMQDLAMRNTNIVKAARDWRNSYGEETIKRSMDAGLSREQADKRMRLMAIEEALADIAGSNAEIKGWSQFVAKLQALLRSMGFDNLADWIEGKTQAETLQLIARTRDAITSQDLQITTQVPAFAREDEPTQSRATNDGMANDKTVVGNTTERSADDVNSGATPLTESQFERKYFQHIDVRARQTENRSASLDAIVRDGFKPGPASVNVLPVTRGRPFANIIERNYSPRAGDRVYLVPREFVDSSKGRSRVKEGYKPKPFEVIDVKTDNPDMYAEYRAGLAKSNEQTTSQDGDVAFSRAGSGDLFDKNATDAQSTYNGTEAVQGMGASIKNVMRQTANIARDKRGAALSFLGGRQIADIYTKDVPELPKYNEILQRMQAEQNEGSAVADSIIEKWRVINRKRPEVATQLSSLMHDATLAQVDPDVSADNAELRKRWVNLPQEAKDIYREARDAYVAHFEKVKAELIDRVERSALDTSAKNRTLASMREEFTKAMKGVYFPLARFGDYMVVVKDKAGVTQSVSMAETTNQAQALRAELLRAYPDYVVGAIQKKKEFNAERDGVSRGFMKDLVSLISEEPDAQIRESQLDAINQLWLSSLPDLSWAKSGIHRKGTPGYSTDAMRAFARNMFHGGYHLAKLRYGDRLSDTLAQMQETIDNKVRANPEYSNVVAQSVVDEMNARHKHIMNPQNTPVANALTGLGFMWHMGLSPASAVVNLSQTALVAYPMLASKFGFGKAATMLLSLSADAVKGKNDLLSQLQGTEKDAYDRAVREGLIDVTMAHDLAGVSQGKSGEFNEKQQRVMRVASVMFHEAEKFNRGVTFMSAYRLAVQSGVSDPYKLAHDLTFDSHFDYSSQNRARIMQGPTARVILLFKQYGQNMIYTLSRNTYKALQGDREAQKTLTGLLAMHGMFAGALGLPLVSTLLAAASAIGGSDDEPWDAQVALRNYLADAFGKDIGEMLAHGVFRAPGIKDAIGADISGRVGLDSMLIRMPQETLEGKKYYQALLETIAGPVFGIGGNIANGMQTMAQGNTLRGIEEMLPKSIKDPLKAYRYEQDGIQDKTGITIVDETTIPEEVAQFLGFSPARGMEGFEGKSAIKNQETLLTQRRRQLMQRYGKDAEEGDTADSLTAIQRWNIANPTMAIRGEDLLRSMREKAKRQSEAENGAYLSKKRRGLAELGSFANSD